jgi:DNA mismatch endonuclease, patch repair protein
LSQKSTSNWWAHTRPIPVLAKALAHFVGLAVSLKLRNGNFRRTRLVPAAPNSTSSAVTAAMRGNRRKDTKPELIVRRELHSLGYRYRLHVSHLPGRPDIVFTRARCAIQVRGCFWHQHLDARCPLRSKPRTNVTYWDAKLSRNVQRDNEQDALLIASGWRVFTVWECETGDRASLCRKLNNFLKGTSSHLH